jgi:serine/threonine-protein kinase
VADTRQGSAAQKQGGKGNNVGLIVAIIGAALVVLIVGSVLAVALLGGLPSGGSSAAIQPTATTIPSFAMPNYSDQTNPMTCTDAKAAAEAKGLKATCVGQASSAPQNQVISQDPTAGTSVKAGAPVTLTFSSGLAPIIMPNVVGQQYANAADTLTSKGLNVIPLTISSDKYASGTVVKTDPVAGTSIQPTTSPKSTQVTVYVSTGPAPTPTPSITATPVTTATATCTPGASGPGTPTPTPAC